MIFKQYDATQNWPWYDSVRGTSLAIRSNSTAAQAAFGDAVVTPQENGFTITGSNTTGINGSSENMIVYGFKAGGNKNTFNVDDIGYSSAASAGMVAGDITPTGCSVNTTSKFSIVKYTGNGSNNQTVAHGLGVVPAFVIVKDLDNTMDWVAKHKYLTTNKILYVQSTSGEDPGTGGNNGIIGDLASATTINFTNGGSGNMNMTNKSSTNYIMYSWADVPGFQKFGAYDGTGSSTSWVNVDLGFRPAQIVIKAKSFSDGWHVYDDKRDTFNPLGYRLWWSSDSSQSSGDFIEFTSTGFRVIYNDNGVNKDNEAFIYCAWAHQPAGTMWGGQSNAF